MQYQRYLPGPSLREFVRNYTIIDLKFLSNGPPPAKERSPKPEQKIVFYLKDPPTMLSPGKSDAEKPPPVCIFSHQLGKRTIRMSEEFLAFIIFLQPGVLHRLIRLPMMELLDGYCDAEFFFGKESALVRERLAMAGSSSEMIAIAEQFLFRLVGQLTEKTSIDGIAMQLTADPAFYSMDSIAQQACLSTRQFYRRFTERIGMSPKLFARLSRFNRAYQFKIAHPQLSWSAIAQEFQYTDYHHLEKECKEFTSLTPNEWARTHLSSPERILKLR